MKKHLLTRFRVVSITTLSVVVGLGAGTAALAALTFGALSVSSDGAYTIDSTGVLELNSSAGVIGIGNDAVAQNINVGTGAAARTITIGNVTGATGLALNAGTGSIALASTGTGDITINSDDTLLLDADGVLELNSSAGVIGIGNDAVAQNINVGTGAAARTITIGNATTTTAVALNSGTGDMTLTSIDDISILGGSAGSVINVGTNVDGNFINIGSDDTAADTITIGSAKDTSSLAGIAVTVGSTGTTSALTLQSGTGDVTITSTDDFIFTATDDISINSGSTSGIINIGTSAFAQVLNLGVNALGNTINVGTDNTLADTVAIGSALDTVTIRGATITIGNASDAAVSIVDNNWSVTTAGAATFVSTAIGGGTALTKVTVGNLADDASGWVPDGAATSFTITADAASVGANSLISVSVGANATATACGVSTRTATTNFVVACSAAPANGATLQYMIVN